MEYRRRFTVNEQHVVKQSMEAANQDRSWDINIVACLMILFDPAEVVMGFTHKFFGITPFNFSHAVAGVV